MATKEQREPAPGAARSEPESAGQLCVEAKAGWDVKINVKDDKGTETLNVKLDATGK